MMQDPLPPNLKIKCYDTLIARSACRVVANCCDPREKVPMYIGIGTLVFILVVVAIIYFVRRA
jgi:hypothetical protein